MSAASAVLRGRRAAQALMVDTCTITRAGAPVTDATTGVVTPTWTTVYAGPCKLGESKGFGASGTEPEAGEHQYVVQGWNLHLPVAVTAPTTGDVATITAAGLDPGLVGRTYRLANEFAKTFATARRFQVEETTS